MKMETENSSEEEEGIGDLDAKLGEKLPFLVFGNSRVKNFVQWKQNASF